MLAITACFMVSLLAMIMIDAGLEAVTDTILRRMHDYVHYICPQFTYTHVNFQRVPVVDTSNPFVARFIPTPDESMLVIRFANRRGIDFPYLLSMLHGSFMSRANTIGCPAARRISRCNWSSRR